MTNHPKKGTGRAITFLREHVGHDGDDCLIWPMSRNPNGYGMMGFEGKQYWAHRLMCELANGPPPSPVHEAAHSCGRGKDGCVHPKHLSWKTPSGNALDSRKHGTQVRSVHGRRGRLTEDEVAQIRSLKGQQTQATIAVQFNISEPTVRDIFHGRSHNGLWKCDLYSKTDEAKIVAAVNRKLSVTEIAMLLGRSESGITAKLKRLRLNLIAA